MLGQFRLGDAILYVHSGLFYFHILHNPGILVLLLVVGMGGVPPRAPSQEQCLGVAQIFRVNNLDQAAEELVRMLAVLQGLIQVLALLQGLVVLEHVV